MVLLLVKSIHPPKIHSKMVLYSKNVRRMEGCSPSKDGRSTVPSLPRWGSLLMLAGALGAYVTAERAPAPADGVERHVKSMLLI